MSSLTIKHAVTQLLVEHFPALDGHIMTQYPRTLEISKAPVIVLWCKHSPGQRIAGSGRSLGAIHGVHQINWNLAVHIINWGQLAQEDGDKFEQMVQDILGLLQSQIDLGGLADDPAHGSQVHQTGQVYSIDDNEPQYNGVFLTLQSSIITRVEEIYNV